MDAIFRLIAQFHRPSKAMFQAQTELTSVGGSAARSSSDLILLTSVIAWFSFIVTLVGLFLSAGLADKSVDEWPGEGVLLLTLLFTGTGFCLPLVAAFVGALILHYLIPTRSWGKAGLVGLLTGILFGSVVLLGIYHGGALVSGSFKLLDAWTSPWFGPR